MLGHDPLPLPHLDRPAPRYEPADLTYAEALANRTAQHAGATAEIAQLRAELAAATHRADTDDAQLCEQLREEIADLRARLAQVADLRDEIARLAPDQGRAPGTAELLSILDSARHAVADYPITDRCGCMAGQVPHDQPVTFHRRGSDHCRAES